MRPRLLDLFCGGGGAGEGYRRAGLAIPPAYTEWIGRQIAEQITPRTGVLW